GDAMDHELRVDPRIHIGANAAGADGVEVRDAVGAGEGLQVRLAGDRGAGQDLLADERLQRRLPGDLAADAHAFDYRLVIVGALQEIEPDLPPLERIRGV